jgi:hypothetical protein
MLHENGKKHRENVERAMRERRINKKREEDSQTFLSDSLKQMEHSALARIGGNPGVAQTGDRRPQSSTYSQSRSNFNQFPNPRSRRDNYNHPSSSQVSEFSSQRNRIATPIIQSSFPNVPHSLDSQASNKQTLPSNNSSISQLQQERIDWQAQKLKREEINSNKRKAREGNSGENDEGQDETSNKRPKAIILPGEGYYSYGHADENDVKREINAAGKDNASKHVTATYLEGEVFFGLLEEDMPVQLWTGPSTSRIEKREKMNAENWKNALILHVVNHQSESTADHGELQRTVVHVSYLSSADDTEETIERKVSLDRIRIVLGGDEKIPDSLEEARLLAMGGEEIHLGSTTTGKETSNNDQKQEIDEATGLSGWSTVSVKKTAHRQQVKEERKRFNESKILATQKREAEQRRIAERQLEESRTSNADDSALGAYDVWGKKDYKGVDISKEVHCSIEDSAKRLATVENLAKGAKVQFKKRTKKKGLRGIRRRTSADDDD